MRYAYNRYFMKIFLLNILLVSKIQVIFASIKRTSKKQFLCYNPFVYSSLLVQKCTTTEQS